MRDILALKPYEGSWMIVNKDSGEPVLEVFKNTKIAIALAHLKPEFTAVPIEKYLSSLNKVLKNVQK